MQLVLNGTCYQHFRVGDDALWHLVETLCATRGWRKQVVTEKAVCLVK